MTFKTKCLTCGEMTLVSNDNSKLIIILEAHQLNHVSVTCHCGRGMVLFLNSQNVVNLTDSGWPHECFIDAHESLYEFHKKVRSAISQGAEGYTPESASPPFDPAQWGGLFDDT